MTTDACVYELLHCVTEHLRGGSKPRVYLQQSIPHDTFIVEAERLSYSTSNDRSLVHKAHCKGYWQRALKISYCSIEVRSVYRFGIIYAYASFQAKSWHDVDEKPFKVEAAHLVGMYAQYNSTRNILQDDVM